MPPDTDGMSELDQASPGVQAAGVRTRGRRARPQWRPPPDRGPSPKHSQPPPPICKMGSHGSVRPRGDQVRARNAGNSGGPLSRAQDGRSGTLSQADTGQTGPAFTCRRHSPISPGGDCARARGGARSPESALGAHAPHRRRASTFI
ncbi:uncharacterized protein [Macaca fascicularis]|uniref:uncharacterized protein n=1 Tax=Macaca fascicularis TaxID=9541 RepID=UPI003D15A389